MEGGIKMRIRYKHQKFQADAAKAVVDVLQDSLIKRRHI